MRRIGSAERCWQVVAIVGAGSIDFADAAGAPPSKGFEKWEGVSAGRANSDQG